MGIMYQAQVPNLVKDSKLISQLPLLPRKCLSILGILWKGYPCQCSGVLLRIGAERHLGLAPGQSLYKALKILEIYNN
mgnify:CR=1 FL=1